MKLVVLDSTPLGLITQRPNAAAGDASRQWLTRKIASGLGIIVPEIVDYELRRELIRADKPDSVRRLDQLITMSAITFLPITSAAMKLAADLWAKARQQGTPMADRHALDIDVILSAQVLAAGFSPGDFIVATANVAHISLFVPARIWSEI